MYKDVQWFSQNIITYKDNSYNSNGFLRVSISTSTQDFSSFNSANFGISISNEFSKSCNLNIYNATDLLLSISQILKNVDVIYNDNNSQILKRYNRDQDFIFEFAHAHSSDERVVRIMIKSNESNFTNVIIPYRLFFVFAQRLKAFVTNYENYSFKVANNFLLKESLNANKKIIEAINSIQLNNVEVIDNVEKTITDSVDIDIENIKESEQTIQDLDKFLGADMENINIGSDISKSESKPLVAEINSPFVKNVIKGNLKNLENILLTYSTSSSPIDDINNRFVNDMMLNEKFTALPHIKESDKKSLFYISKMFFNVSHRNYINNCVAIPNTLPVLKYKIDEDVLSDNFELAFDLFLISGYFRSYRSKLESKDENAMTNGAMIYLLVRNFLDPFIFGFLDKLDSIALGSFENSIISRFKYYKQIGVFEKYDTHLNNFSFEITENDIMSFVKEIKDNVINKNLYINQLHDKLYDSGTIKLPANNKLNLEQITNEFILLEVHEKFGMKVDTEETILGISDNISKDVIDMFTKKITPKRTNVKKQTDSNLSRFVREYRNEIPKNIRDEFLKYVEKLGEKDFDFNVSKFSFNEFGDNIIKALYLWKPTSDPRLTLNYKYFFELYENELMNKDLILSKFLNDNDDDNEKEDVEWNELF